MRPEENDKVINQDNDQPGNDIETVTSENENMLPPQSKEEKDSKESEA